MKRFLIVLVALSLFVTCAFAESIDLESMTTDDLVALRDAINAELAKRNFAEKEVVVPAGEYIIGVDIPAGAYTIALHGAAVSFMEIYSEDGRILTSYTILPSAPVGKHELKEGQTIHISYDPVVFSPYAGLGF